LGTFYNKINEERLSFFLLKKGFWKRQ